MVSPPDIAGVMLKTTLKHHKNDQSHYKTLTVQ